MYTVAALYHFTPLPDIAAIAEPLRALGARAHIKGTLLVAPEGINGTMAGSREGIDAMLAHIRGLPGCADLEWKESTASEQPFPRLKVRLKREIVTMGQPDVNPREKVGTYVEPEDWNALIRDPEVAVIDTRNDYEISIGTFDGAIDPETASFREFPQWWQDNKERFHNKKIAMFCTGGIRCEKASNYLLGQGVEEVHHLHGGILKYLEDVPHDKSFWNGDCFVFDGRVSVGHGLVEGPHHLCHACRRPILPDDMERPEHEPGVSCHHCINETSEADKQRFRERQKQIRLSRERGEQHIGTKYGD